MDQKPAPQKPVAKTNHTAVVAMCLAFVGGMVGMSYAAVPLYKLYCQVTGYNGTVRRVEQASNVILDRTVKVRFDSNVNPGLNWEFEPFQREIEVKIGETVQVMYRAKNLSMFTTKGQAVYNVTPQVVGAYFNKVQCFCFTETTLKPGQEIEMPVVFFVDPDLVNEFETKNVKTITLSYTFYPHDGDKPVASAADKLVTDEKKL